jgi:hypothetical protein
VVAIGRFLAGDFTVNDEDAVRRAAAIATGDENQRAMRTMYSMMVAIY